MDKTKKRVLLAVAILACTGIILAAAFFLLSTKDKSMPNYETEIIRLPEPRHDSETSIEESLLKRRSVRDYSDEPLTLSEISQLLWAVQGTTNKEIGFRTAPSAGALYPLEVYIVAGNVNRLPDGIYKYKTREHGLERIAKGDKRAKLYSAALE